MLLVHTNTAPVAPTLKPRQTMMVTEARADLRRTRKANRKSVARSENVIRNCWQFDLGSSCVCLQSFRYHRKILTRSTLSSRRPLLKRPDGLCELSELRV